MRTLPKKLVDFYGNSPRKRINLGPIRAVVRDLGISDGWSAAKDDASLGNFPANVSGLQVLHRSEVPVAVALPPPFAK